MSQRYASLFARLQARKEGALVPFSVLGDPHPDISLDLISAMVEAGADALELGFAFSDPVADGPTIQKANQRALAAGVRKADAFRILSELRGRHPDVPIGLLVYANLVGADDPEDFYRRIAEAGADSVLVADVPVIEAKPYVACAHRQGVAPVLIATHNTSDQHLAEIAGLCEGYTYVVTRTGVTGADQDAQTGHGTLIAKLASLGAPPCLLGFGISHPDHVRSCIQAGAAGAISGSAVVRLIEAHTDDPAAMLAAVGTFIADMKAATTS